MPDYYLLPEQDKREPATFDSKNYIYNKPSPQNLVLPSIHASRTDNVLLVDNDAQEAVEALISSCCDSERWPSHHPSEASQTKVERAAMELTHPNFIEQLDLSRMNDVNVRFEGLEDRPRLHTFTRHKPPSLTYDFTEPNVIKAARDLFFEWKRQQILYGALPSWGRTPRMPSDYELFALWASLSKSEKMKYIAEVNGASSEACVPTNYLESQRAVMFLYTSCPDSHSWPSFQFSQAPGHTRPLTFR